MYFEMLYFLEIIGIALRVVSFLQAVWENLQSHENVLGEKIVGK